MTRGLVAGLARLLCGASARWLGCEPSTRQRIYFANHTSNLDAVVVWAALPPEVREVARPVAAREYWTSNRLRRWLAERIFDAVLIDRRRVTARENPVEIMLAAMGEMRSIILFPEGGRQPGPEVAPFKSGLYHLARKRPDAELVPVFIDNMNRILPKGEVLPVPLLGSIAFGAPIRLAEGERKPEFLERARAAVAALRHP